MSVKAYEIALLPGDGIGPEVTTSAERVLVAAANGAGLELNLSSYAAGAGHYRDSGVAIDEETIRAVGSADATFLGAMGPGDIRYPDGTEIAPQLDLRDRYSLFASVRPVRQYAGVDPVLRTGDVEMVVVRETTEGLFARRNNPAVNPGVSVTDQMVITRKACERLFHLAFQLAQARRDAGLPGRVALLDKANVLQSFSFMRQVFYEVGRNYADIAHEALYVDAAVMLMVSRPERFDVIVTENQFGDIVSELAAGIAGGLGLAPSADIGADVAVFQPCHGSAPDIAGLGVANPIGAIMSMGMLLDWLADRHGDARARQAAAAIRGGAESVLQRGIRTPDLGGNCVTNDVTTAIVNAIESLAV